MSDPDFLTVENVIALHGLGLAEHGGLDGIRDRGLLESAVHAPQASWDGVYLHATLFAKAAAYAFSIAQNQPFVDGNKRAALLSAMTFLAINGVEIADPDQRLYDAMIAIADKTLDQAGLAALLATLAAPSP